MKKIVYVLYNFFSALFEKVGKRLLTWSKQCDCKKRVWQAKYLGLETKWIVSSYNEVKEALIKGKSIRATKVYLLDTLKDKRSTVCILPESGIPGVIRVSRVYDTAEEAINSAIRDLKFNPMYIKLPTETAKEDETLTEKEQEEIKLKEDKIRKNIEQKNRHKKNKQKGKERK